MWCPRIVCPAVVVAVATRGGGGGGGGEEEDDDDDDHHHHHTYEVSISVLQWVQMAHVICGRRQPPKLTHF